MSKVTKTEKNSSQTFLKGALVLTISMIAVKLCGLVQKVMLTNLFGSLGENYGAFGSALFSNAYEIYVPLFTLATVGFPIAISRLISESYAKQRYKDIRQIYRVSRPFFIVMGVVCFSLMFFGSFWYIRYINSPYSLYAMLILAPTIFFGCLVSIYRGYFEGLRNMTPTAVSEVIEALSKIAIGVVLAYVMLHFGMQEYTASQTVFGLTFNSADEAYRTLISFCVAASIFGITCGSVLSFLFLKIRFVRRNGDIPPEYYANSVEAMSKRVTFNKIIKIALPVGIGALVMSFSSSIDAMILQKLLYGMAVNNPAELLAQFNGTLKNEVYSSEITAHTCIWGYYSSSLTILSVVTSITQVFGTSAMPNVTNAYTKGDRRELKSSIQTVLKLTTMVAFPMGLGMLVLARPILATVYRSDPSIATFGAPSLQVMGIAVLFMGLLTPVCSMLQGVGKVNTTMFVYIGGMSLKVLISFLFARNITINIVGAAIGTLIAYFIMCVISLYTLLRHTHIRPDFLPIILKPLLSAVACGGCAYLCCFVLGLNVLISIGISAIIYIAFLLVLHTFTRNEIVLLPKGEKIVIILEKLHLIG